MAFYEKISIREIAAESHSHLTSFVSFIPPQLHLSTPSQEINREEAESTRRIMDGSPPTPRSLRLDRVAVSQEELGRFVSKFMR